MMARMSELELLGYLKAEADSAYHHSDGDMSSDRIRAMRDYLRMPYGTEEDGRSSVVASDVFDAVEGMLPDLIDVFVSTNKAVVFEPVGPEDEEAAEQVTDVANYVFYKQNNGFVTLYTAAKDGLLMKTGGVKWYWDKRRTPTFTTYRNVDEMQLASFLATNPKAEVVEKEEVEPTPEEIQQAQMVGMVIPPRYTVKIKVVEEKGCVKLCNIPPEELQVSRRHNSILLDECPYVAHVVEKTYSDILEMGYNVTVDQVKAAKNDLSTADEDFRENIQGGKWGWWKEDNDLDPAMVTGYLREEYVLVDFDGDGIAERRRIVRLGNEVLSNEECSHIPIAAWTPYILTHRFDGLSVADLVSDFQRISTEILRQQLDNLYLANNQETVVLTDAQGNPLANIDDLLNRRPGGIIRERAQGAVRPYQERWQGIEAMPMIEMLDSKKENRTGYTKYSQGLDANALNKTATGVSMIMSASQKRMKLMARIMAETLVAPIFKGILKTLSDYGMEQLAFRLNNKFVQYDPQEWRDQFDMTINVGLGSSDQQQKIMMLGQMMQAQMALMATPFGPQLVSPKTVYNLQARIAENAGFKNPQEFWVDPDTIPPQPPQEPQPDPLVMAEQVKAQAQGQKAQAEMQFEAQKVQAEMTADQQKAVAEMTLAKQKFEMELAFKAQESEKDRQHQMQLELVKIQARQQEVMAPIMAPIEAENTRNDAIAQAFVELARALNAPKQVIRDETGRAVGVAPIQGA
jgi:hypothetical protein